MPHGDAQTISEANAQEIEVKDYLHWQILARQVDGYALLIEMGYPDRKSWAGWARTKREEALNDNGTWQTDRISLIDLRILLFLKWRALRFSWGPEPFDSIDALLHAIAKKLEHEYVTDMELRQEVITDDSNYPPFFKPMVDRENQ